MANKKAKKQKLDTEKDFEVDDEENESYSARVRKRLKEKSLKFPPGVIPLLEKEIGETLNSSTSCSLASLSSDSDSDTEMQGNAIHKKTSSGRRTTKESTVLDESFDINKFWEDSPKRTSKSIINQSLSVIDCVTIEDSPPSHQNSFEDVVEVEDTYTKELQEEVEREHAVKIRFQGQIQRVGLKQGDFFKVLYERLASLIPGASSHDISIYYEEKTINPFDTLSKVPLRVGDILEAYILKKTEEKAGITHSSDMLQLKIQTKDRKDVVNISLRKEDNMAVLMQKYADLKNLKVSQLKFFFDGEPLDPQETSKSLDLEGEECIDVYRV